MTVADLLWLTWFRPALGSQRHSSWAERGRSLIMLLGFAAFLALLSGIFSPILAYFWKQEAFGQVLTRALVYFIFLALGILTVFSAVISMSSRFYTAADAEWYISRPIDEKIYFRFRYWQGALATSWMLLPFWGPFLFSLRRAAGAGWGFVLWGFAVPLPLGWIACSLAAGLVMLASRRFSARRLRNGFGAATAMMAVGLILLLRLIQPEKLTRPDSAVTLEQFLKTWSPSAHLFDPVALAADGVLDALSNPGGALLRSSLLWLIALCLYRLMVVRAAPGFIKTWLASRELMGPGSSRSQGASRLWAGAQLPWGLLWLKEFSALIRNPVLRLQLVMVAALSGIFLFNLYRLPFQDDPSLRQILFLPACGFSQLILISVATRFIFPIESVEAHGSWMLRVAPMPRGSFLASRLWIYGPPLLALNLVLVLSCIRAFQPEPPKAAVALLLMLCCPFGVAGITAYLGLAWKQRDVSQPEEVTTSPAGILVMVISLLYVGAQLALFYLPLQEIRRHELQLMVPLNWLIFAVSGGLWVLIQALAIGWPMWLASRRMEAAG